MIYIANILLTILWSKLLLHNGNGKRKRFIIIVSIQAILISGLRALSVGADTETYELLFMATRNKGWGTIKSTFINFIMNQDYNSRDMGYYLIVKAFSTIFPSYRLFLFFVITVFMTALGKFLYKYSEDLCLSYIIFDSFMFQFYGLTGIRQTLAVVLVTFVGYRYIKEKKLLKFLVLCLVAATVHTTSIVFVPFYFICNAKPHKFKYNLTVAVAIFIVAFKGALSKVINIGIYSQLYRNISGISSYSFISMMAVIVVGIILFKTKIDYAGENNRDFVDGTLISFIFILSSIVFDLLFRLAWFYMPFLLVLLPQLLKGFKPKSRRLVRSILIIVAILILYKNTQSYLDYSFFWM